MKEDLKIINEKLDFIIDRLCSGKVYVDNGKCQMIKHTLGKDELKIWKLDNK